MIIFICSILFALFAIECNGTRSCCFSPSPEFKIDEFQYEVDLLDNGRGLSLFMHGAANEIRSEAGLLFRFASEWFRESKNNICIVTYCFTTKRSIGFTRSISNLGRLVSSKRLEYVAKMARDLVLEVQRKCVTSTRRQCLRNLSQVDVTGFSFGAHIAARTCEYLFRSTGERVRLLLGLDPSRTPPFVAKPPHTGYRGFADYTQVVHSSNVLGVWDQLGDTDIYIKHKPDSDQSFLNTLAEKHGLVFYLHAATATKRLCIIADKNKNATGKILYGEERPFPEPNQNECILGVYSTKKEYYNGQKFTISLVNRSKYVYDVLGEYTSDRMFFE
ncbi:uncharacterized protein LOC116348370 isoform X2 [Contarinia nasturtii]|uniref:uncharacterized protein LOC116348370 isoform X2 n=1 Tax=Contarinia nasturtii TaxID=265458 RepID=UPI0012D3ADFB|nr:uncharacterized protein LOC116348370 isoform X2 [Contarinia nasturtii]